VGAVKIPWRLALGMAQVGISGCFARMQKKMQKVVEANLKNRMKSASSKKFDSAPGHHSSTVMPQALR
jgi:hypothetical protein